MDVVTLALLAVGLALDAFVVALACGLAFARREHLAAFRIAASFGLFQGGMPALGWLVGRGLHHLITSVDHWAAFGLLGAVGSRMIFEAVRSHQGATPLRPPGLGRLLGLSVATSVDALAVGLSLAMIEVPIVRPALAIGGVTLALSYGGVVIGHEFERRLRGRWPRNVQIVGGLVLLGIGVRILAQHLGA